MGIPEFIMLGIIFGIISVPIAIVWGLRKWRPNSRGIGMALSFVFSPIGMFYHPGGFPWAVIVFILGAFLYEVLHRIPGFQWSPYVAIAIVSALIMLVRMKGPQCHWRP